ncbi:MAG: septation protein SpoVG family protein [Lachnospiraceae bacterium]|nr:septation protein SpoVG family protein [Lachnospiraceae bacterium]MBR3823704.1 septation protein SpoVG family protein [Lachnospiraceae bacterium]MBR4083357.1 septation protein SpoVG family protein [Lachnospiraceae bacterium]MBR6628322.1 septation protein SpoVG family protein [Lachnospiraceae bacterium]
MPRNAATQVTEENNQTMEQQVPFEVTIKEHNPERGVLATADVMVAGVMTIRNVKIKEDDYGITVTMPRTKMPHTDEYKDSVYFADKNMKQLFDQTVENAYQQSMLAPVLDQEEMEEDMDPEEEAGLSMEM